MGKKDKKAQGAKPEQQGSIPWKEIDKDPVGFLVAPEVRPGSRAAAITALPLVTSSGRRAAAAAL